MTGNSDTRSPLTGSRRTEIIDRLAAASVIELYRRNFGVEVGGYFAGVTQIDLNLCLDTGYRFFTPLTLAADEQLYRRLQGFPWYYRADKWEHRIAIRSISRGQKLLEIGCGQGAFLALAQEHGATAVGIELNAQAAEACRRRGLDVSAATMAAFRSRARRTFDVICAFQVLEHIAAPAAFLGDAIRLLGPDGVLILSVPNNDSFIFQNRMDGGLNLPPHHMGWWNGQSLLSLQRYFPLRLEALHYEPSLPDGMGLVRDYFRQIAAAPGSPLERMRYRIARGLIQDGLGALAAYIPGHSLVAVFRRTGGTAVRPGRRGRPGRPA